MADVKNVKWQLRPYRGGDEEAIVALWNESMPQDTVSPELFRNRVLLDVNFDPEGTILAVDKAGQPVGFILAMARKTPIFGTDLEPENGWISIFFVKPSVRGQGMVKMLLGGAEAFLRSKGRKNIFVSSYSPNYFFPGVDKEMYKDAVAFLEKNGYGVLYQAVAMDKNLVGFAVPDDVKALKAQREAEGYKFGCLNSAFLTRTIAFATENFGVDWGRAIREGVARGLGFDRFLIATKGEEVVGFTVFGAYDNVAERFGPFGVAEKLRGAGLGKILLYETLDFMRQRGSHGAWFLWTGEESAAGKLYRRAGFTITRRFNVMKRVL